MLLLISSHVPPPPGLFIKSQGVSKCSSSSFSTEIQGLSARLTNTFSLLFLSHPFSGAEDVTWWTAAKVRRGHGVTGNTRGHNSW